MALGEGRLAAAPLRMLSVGVGLGTEVTAFETSSRAFTTLAGENANPNLWNWNGEGGLRQGLLTSLLTFGMLKGAGHLSRESNVVFQHAFSSTAMVAGHQSASMLGIISRPEGSLAEQLLHAEMTNLQLGAGTSLLHTVAPEFTPWNGGSISRFLCGKSWNPVFLPF